MRSASHNQHVSGIFLIIGACFAFAFGDMIVRIVSPRYTTFEIVAIAGGIFTLQTFAKVAVKRRFHLLKTTKPGLLIVRGLITFLHFIVCFYAYSHMPVINAYSFLFFAPVLVTLMSSLLLKEKVGWQIWLAVSAGFCGILIMLRPGIFAIEPALFVAMLMPLTECAITILMRYASQTETNESILFYSSVIITVCSLGAGFNRMIMPSTNDLALFLLLGIATTIGWFLSIQGYRQATTPVGAPFQYVQLLWATLMGWLIWGTLPDLWRCIGMLIVVGSGLFVLWHEQRPKYQTDLELDEPYAG